ncbi:hypothetical protein LLG95_00925 [bacterium]|nr:hypothetical protein [bacterium]
MNHLTRLAMPALLMLMLACNPQPGGNAEKPAETKAPAQTTAESAKVPATQPAAEKTPVHGPNPRFYEVTQRLDAGGSFYMYADLKDVLRDFVAGFKPVVNSGPPQAQQIYEKINQSLDQLGVYGIHDIGVSSLPEKGLYLNKLYISMPGGVKGLPALLGQIPHKIEGLAYAPAGTRVFIQTDLYFDQALGIVRQEIGRYLGPQMVEQFNRALAALDMQLGVNVELLIKSLGNRITIIADQDPNELVNLGPEVNAQFKAPRVALMVAVKDDTLYKTIAQKAMALGSEPPQTTGGLTITPINVPQNPKYKVSPVVAGGKEFVIISTHANLVKDMMAAATTGGMANTEEFKQLSAGLPAEGNGMAFASKGLFDAIRQVLAQIEDQPGQSKNDELKMAFRLSQLPETGSYAIRRHEPDGIMVYSRTATGGNQVIGAIGVMPVAMMAAIAVPGYLEAQNRARVKRADADMRSLQNAMDAYSVEFGGGYNPSTTNEFDAQANISQVQSDLRSIAVGIESYGVDCNSYPAWSSNPNENYYGKFVRNAPQLAKEPSFRFGAAPGMYSLTSPISYMSTMPRDPFAPAMGATYAFYSTPGDPNKAGWIVWSPGPDGKYDLDSENISRAYPAAGKGPSELLIQLTYDPTNGTKSSGDIYRVKMSGGDIYRINQ